MKKRIALTVTGFALVMLLSACQSKTETQPVKKAVEEQEMTLELADIGEREGIYTGETLDDIPNGKGKFVTHDPEGKEWYYDGSWTDGQMDDTPTVEEMELTVEMKDVGEKKGSYTGEVRELVPNGKGKFVTQNSEGVTWYYEGNWVLGEMEGTGVQEWEELGQRYEGDFVENDYCGTGKLYLENSLAYEGNFAEGRCEGAGKLYNKKGEVCFEGEFKAGIPADLEKVKSIAKSVTYEELARDENTYYWDIVSVTGKIGQVEEVEDNLAAYLVVCDDLWKETFLVSYTRPENETRILDGDNVTFYGQSKGLVSYESIWGQTITVPYIEAFCK
ncbi:MAG: hypothetical protein HFH53_01865 [Hespellia sp.]|jgi:hypothetical protein|nr:hypothetical protein [Hespellia sp.]